MNDWRVEHWHREIGYDNRPFDVDIYIPLKNGETLTDDRIDELGIWGAEFVRFIIDGLSEIEAYDDSWLRNVVNRDLLELEIIPLKDWHEKLEKIIELCYNRYHELNDKKEG